MTRIYDNSQLVECIWKGLIGIFPLEDIKIFSKADLYQDKEGNLRVKSFDSKSDTASIKSMSDDNKSLKFTNREPESNWSQGSYHNNPVFQNNEGGKNFMTFHKTRQGSEVSLGNNGLNKFKEDSVVSGGSSLSQSSQSSTSRKPLKMLKRQQKKLEQSIQGSFRDTENSIAESDEMN